MNKIYVRISTDQQEQDRQIYILNEKGYNYDNSIIYQETLSGKNRNRPVLIKLLDELRSGDIVIVTDLSRLARSVKDLWEISDEIISKKATLVSLKEMIDLGTSTGRLLFTMIGGIYQFERDVLSDRTKEALAAKKKNGVVLGRPATIDKSNYDLAVEEYMNSRKSLNEIGKKYGMSGVSVYNELKKRGLKRLKKGEMK